MTDNILSLLGLAHKAGRVEIGEEPVGGAARAKKARVILIAQDAAPSSRRRAQSFAETGNCLYLIVPAEKDAIGRALGRSSCAMCAVTDIGFANALAHKLAVKDEKYQAAASTLDTKAKRAAQRKKEQLQHEKNLKAGKKRERTAPLPEPVPHSEQRYAKDPVHKTPPKRSRRPKQDVQRPRFADSLPVKKGKGSKVNNNRVKTRSQH